MPEEWVLPPPLDWPATREARFLLPFRELPPNPRHVGSLPVSPRLTAARPWPAGARIPGYAFPEPAQGIFTPTHRVQPVPLSLKLRSADPFGVAQPTGVEEDPRTLSAPLKPPVPWGMWSGDRRRSLDRQRPVECRTSPHFRRHAASPALRGGSGHFLTP